MKNNKLIRVLFAVFFFLSLFSLSTKSYGFIDIKEIFYILTSFIFFLIFINEQKVKLYIWDGIFLTFIILNITFLFFIPYKYYSIVYIDILITSLFFYLSLRMFSPKFLSFLLEFAGFIAATYGILLSMNVDFFNFYSNPDISRTPSFFGNSNFFAGILIVFISITLINFIISENKLSKVVHGIVLLIDFYAMFLTKTRAAFLGLLFSIFIIFYYVIKYKLLKKKVMLFLGLIIIVVILVVPKDYWQRIKAVKDISHGTPMFRVYTWNSTLHIIKDHPLGVGPGNFRIIYPMYKSKRIFLFEGHHNAETIHAHNDFLENASDLGFIGLFLYLLLIFSLIAIFIYFINFLENKKIEQGILIGLYGSLIGFLVDNIFSVNLKWLSSIIIFYYIIGMTFAIVQKYKKPVIQISLRKYSIFILILFLIIIIPSYKRYRSNIFLQKAIAFSKAGVEYRDVKKQPQNGYKYFIQAKKMYKKALKTYKYNIIALYFMGNQYIDLYSVDNNKKELYNALNCYKKVQQISPNYVQIHFLKGKVYYFLRQYKQALKEFNLYLKQDPVDTNVYRYLSRIYELLGKKEKIKELLEDLKKEIDSDLNIKPNYKKLYIIMEQVYKNLGYSNRTIIEKYQELYKKVNKENEQIPILKRLTYYYLKTDYKQGQIFFKNINSENATIKKLKSLFIEEKGE